MLIPTISSVTNRAIIIFSSTDCCPPIIFCSPNVVMIHRKQSCLIYRHALFDTYSPIITTYSNANPHPPLVHPMQKNTRNNLNNVDVSNNWLNPVTYHHSSYQTNEEFIKQNNIRSNINKRLDSNSFWKLLIGYNTKQILPFQTIDSKAGDVDQQLHQLYITIIHQLQYLGLDQSKYNFKQFIPMYFKLQSQYNHIDSFFRKQHNQWIQQSMSLISQIKSNVNYKTNCLTLNISDEPILNRITFVLNHCISKLSNESRETFKCQKCDGNAATIMSDTNFLQCLQCDNIYSI